MGLRPIDADVYLIYKCSNCDNLHTITRKETVFPGGILCGCGNEMRLEPIHHISVYFNRPKNQSIIKPQEQKNPEKNRGIYQNVVDSLAKLGYNKREARRRVDALSCLRLSEEEILQKIILEEQKNG